jgi:hypothetical protein
MLNRVKPVWMVSHHQRRRECVSTLDIHRPEANQPYSGTEKSVFEYGSYRHNYTFAHEASKASKVKPAGLAMNGKDIIVSMPSIFLKHVSARQRSESVNVRPNY